jgi:cobalamin transport system ATP-binding protein
VTVLPQPPLVSFDTVSIAYAGHEVVHAVSFSVRSGEWMGILGPNGAGKSSLLRSLVGGPTSGGRTSVAGHDMSAIRGRARSLLIAYVPQRPLFPSGMAVFDYVLLGRTPHLGMLAAERREDLALVWEALRSLELTGFAERDLGSLSGGETQRVAMARVIAQEAPVLVLDEATASLDVARQHQVLELVDRVRTDRGIAVISAMHDLTAAAQFCDRVALLDDGMLRGVGSPDEVLEEPLLRDVFEPTVRVIEVEGARVIVSMRDKERR